MNTRFNIYRRLIAASRALDTTPTHLFGHHEWRVGHFPATQPLPRLSRLTDGQLGRLVDLAEQQVRIKEGRL